MSATAAALCVGLLAVPAYAQETCDGDAGVPPASQGSLDSNFPGAGQDGVPLDGFVRLRYRFRVPSRPFVAVSELPSLAVVDGTANIVGAEVHWRSRERLRSNTEYSVRAADQSGTETSFTFRTGWDTSGDALPSFRGIRRATYQRAGQSDLCGDADALEVTVEFERSTGSRWPSGDIEYVIFQTAGRGIEGPVERARDRGRPSGSGTNTTQSRSFRLSSRWGLGPVCFMVLAMDPLGRYENNTIERCFDPSAGNHFVGCAVARRGAPQGIAGRGHGARNAIGLATSSCAFGFVALRRRRRRAAS